MPRPAAELESARSALANARAAGAASERERAYIAAVEIFYRDSGRLDHRTRVHAYSAAMERLHRRYPQDQEAAIFYALSLIAAGTKSQMPFFRPTETHGNPWVYTS